MSDISSASFRSFYAAILHKSSNYLVGITFLCYISGFVITNLYLGSLGVVNLDLLRARYILSGLLFLLFMGVIIYLTFGLHQILLKDRNKAFLGIINDVAWYSLVNIGLLFFVILAATKLAGTTVNPPIGIPKLSVALPWSAWLTTVPITILGQIVLFALITLPIIILILLAFIAITPIDMQGFPTTRKQALAMILKNPKLLIARMIFVYVLFYILGIGSNLIYFMRTNEVVGMISPSTNSHLLEGGWMRFFVFIAATYIMTAMILIYFRVMPRTATEYGMPSNRWRVYFASAAIAIIVPVYSLGIYPDLPQQLGGGKILPVSITTSSQELKPYFSDQNIDTYLIDRASSSMLFLLVSKIKPEHRTIEVSSSLIGSVTYLSPP